MRGPLCPGGAARRRPDQTTEHSSSAPLHSTHTVLRMRTVCMHAPVLYDLPSPPNRSPSSKRRPIAPSPRRSHSAHVNHHGPAGHCPSSPTGVRILHTRIQHRSSRVVETAVLARPSTALPGQLSPPDSRTVCLRRASPHATTSVSLAFEALPPPREGVSQPCIQTVLHRSSCTP